MAEKTTLPQAVAAKFNLIPGIGIGEFYFKGKTYDLATISVEQAETLVADGCDILVPTKTATSEKK
jgi:hypothetical protein